MESAEKSSPIVILFASDTSQLPATTLEQRNLTSCKNMASLDEGTEKDAL